MLGSTELVLPALHERIATLNLAAHLPTDIENCLSAVAELNRERNSEILYQLREIAAALNRAGIEPVVLKGLAYLLTGTYSDAAARYLSDIDLLVPKAQLRSAVEVLQGYGYQPDETDPVASFRHHLPTFSRAGSLPVELHHSVGLGVCQKILPAEELIHNSSLMTWNGVRVRIPSPDHLVTHLIIHSQLVHPYVERIWPPLRALYDLASLERRFETSIGWAEIAQRFQSRRQYATFFLHLLQAEQSLGTPLQLAVSMLWSERLRWSRRQLLRRFPKLRFVDPLFLFYSVVSRRARVVKRMILSGTWKHVIKRLLRPALYRRLVSEIDLP